MGAGDIATVLSLEDFEYVSGLREAAAETRRFAGESEGALATLGEGIEHASHRGIRGLEHLAFAMSEGEGGLGHKIASLAGTIPLVTGAFGPWGLAIGGAAAVLSAALIPKLQEGEEAAKEFAKALAESGKEFERFIGLEKSGIGFKRRLERIDASTSPESIQSQKESAEDTAAELKDEIARRRLAFRNAASDLATKGGLEGDLAGHFGPNNEERGAFTFRTQGNQGQDLKAEAEAAKEMYDKLKAAEEELERMEHRAEALGEKLEDSIEYHTALEEQKKLLEEEKKREELAGKIAKEIETPFEKAQAHLRELADAAARDIITPDQFDRASEKALSDLEHATPHSAEQHNAAVAGGTSAAYEAIRASIKSTEHAEDTPQIKALREQLTVMKQQLSATQEVARKEPVVVKF